MCRSRRGAINDFQEVGPVLISPVTGVHPKLPV